MARYRFSRTHFERLVEDALAELPRRFADAIENVVIVVEDEPAGDDLDAVDDLDDDDEEELLGIYRGVPLTERSRAEPPLLPDEIAIFQGPIERIATTRDEVVAEVRETVIHELGHYFGLDDDELP